MTDDDLKNISYITYNFTESRHGKSAADGVGAVIKRSADNLVACCEDIGDYQSFVNAIKLRQKSVFIETILKEDIIDVDKIIPSNLKTFVGTMKAHQWTWNRKESNFIMFRNLSCYKCSSVKTCKHHHLGKWAICEEEPKTICEIRKSNRLKRS